jgi:hypothetical protein
MAACMPLCAASTDMGAAAAWVKHARLEGTTFHMVCSSCSAALTIVVGPPLRHVGVGNVLQCADTIGPLVCTFTCVKTITVDLQDSAGVCIAGIRTHIVARS